MKPSTDCRHIGKSELVSGFILGSQLLYFLAVYANIIVMSTLGVILSSGKVWSILDLDYFDKGVLSKNKI